MTEEELLAELHKSGTILRRPLGSVGDWVVYKVNVPVMPRIVADPETVWKMVAKGLLFVGKSDSLDFVLLSTPSNEQKWKKLQKIAREIARLTADDLNVLTPHTDENHKKVVDIMRNAREQLDIDSIDKWLLEGTSVVREKETW